MFACSSGTCRERPRSLRGIALSSSASPSAGDSGTFFTEPHYDGYPAVLARLPAMDRQLLREVLIEAWRVQAPRALVREWDAR
jgi:hypothetical protein